MHPAILIALLSLLVQALSFVVAARMLRHAGSRPLAAVLLAVIFLMGLRRSVDLAHSVQGDVSHVDVLAQVISLVISCLILAGVIFIRGMIVSESRTAEAAITAVARYRVLFDQSPDGVLLFDADGAIVDFNDRACMQLGYTREEFKRLGIPDIDPVERPEQIRARFEQTEREGTAEFDAKHKTKDGEVRDVRVIVQTVTLSGRPFHHAIWRDITDRKKAEDRLRRSEQTYRTLAENIPGIVCRVMLGPPASIRFYNSMGRVITGYEENELATDGICALEQLIVPEDRPRVDEAVRRAIAEQRPYAVEYQVRHRDGSLRYVVDRGTPEQGDDGEPLFVDCVIFDVTEGECAEAALRESEERFRDVVAAAGEYVWEVDASLRLTYLSERAAALSGYSLSELLGRPVFDFSPPRDRERFKAVASEIMGKQEPVSRLEQRVLNRAGQDRYLRITGVPIIRNGVLRGYRGTALDVTEQKQTAEELDRYRRTLEESVMRRTTELQNTIERLVEEISERAAAEKDLQTNRQFLNSILNSMQDPIMVLDRNLHILLANRSFEAAFTKGQSMNFLEGTCHEVFYGRTRSCATCLSRQVMNTGMMATRMLTRNDEDGRKWYDISAFPLFTAEGRIIGSVHHMRDITGRKLAEDKVEKYQEHLRLFALQLIRTEERERRKIAQALHDGFPQKLALSKLFLQKMQSELPAAAGTSETFSRIYELYDGMSREVRFLTYELAPPILYEVGLEPALERLLENMLSGSGIDWVFENWRSGPPLRGESATVLYAMVRELIMNVLKYAEAGYLKVTLAQWGDMVLTVVQDDGKGMLPEAARREGREQDLNGFGLFSLRERVRYLHGQLAIESGPGKGTMVRIEIPSGGAMAGPVAGPSA